LPAWFCTETHASCGANFVLGSAVMSPYAPANNYAYSTGNLTYYTEVTGPAAPAVPVSLQFYADALASFLVYAGAPAGGWWDATYGVSIYNGTTSTLVFQDYSLLSAGYTGVGNNPTTYRSTISSYINSVQTPTPMPLGAVRSDVLSLVPNTLYRVSVFETLSYHYGYGVATLFIDPSLTINSQIYPGYTVGVSPGILNALTPGADPIPSAVPEPSSYLLVLAGLCIFPLVRRRAHAGPGLGAA